MVERHGDRMDGPLSLSLAGRGLLTLPDLSGIHSGSAARSVKHRNEFQENMLKTRIINQKQVHRHKLVTVGLEKIPPLSDLSGFGTQQSAFFSMVFFSLKSPGTPSGHGELTALDASENCLSVLENLVRRQNIGRSGRTDGSRWEQEKNGKKTPKPTSSK